MAKAKTNKAKDRQHKHDVSKYAAQYARTEANKARRQLAAQLKHLHEMDRKAAEAAALVARGYVTTEWAREERRGA